jgi:hypothetical protein
MGKRNRPSPGQLSDQGHEVLGQRWSAASSLRPRFGSPYPTEPPTVPAQQRISWSQFSNGWASSASTLSCWLWHAVPAVPLLRTRSLHARAEWSVARINAHHNPIQARRQEADTETFRQEMQIRAGIDGAVSEIGVIALAVFASVEGGGASCGPSLWPQRSTSSGWPAIPVYLLGPAASPGVCRAAG